MSNPVLVQPSGVQATDATPASSAVSANTRVSAAAGALGVLTDVLQFSGASVAGIWAVGATRVLVNGVPVVTQAAAGTSIGAPPTFVPSGAMTVGHGDARVKAI